MAKFDFGQYFLVSLGAGAASWLLFGMKLESGTVTLWSKITSWIIGLEFLTTQAEIVQNAVIYLTFGLIVAGAGFAVASWLKK